MACPNRELETMSVRKQIREMGAKNADDLIATMMFDHEQAQPGPLRCNPRGQPLAQDPVRSKSLPDPNNPITSLVSRLWRSKTLTEEILVPASLAIKQSHWKPLATASKCAAPNCRKLFTSVRDKRRNCAMCGKVFCRICTNYSRRLSANAMPDPLGQFHSVCQACFNLHNAFGGFRDKIRDFTIMRQKRLDLLRGSEAAYAKHPLCSRRTSDGKKLAMKKEIERLVEGYKTNLGKMRGLVSEVIVPDWQKSSNWVLSKNALACLNCAGVFGVLKRKLHCRIGGQVFCSNCANDELILYIDENGEVKWGLNGKAGGPTKVPEKYRLLVLCSSCSLELQGMLMESVSKPPPSVFFDSLHTLHSQLSKVSAKIDKDLPDYKQLVEAMDASDSSPDHVKEKHPMRLLIKAHVDLSDAFSCLAVESQKLKVLKPKSPIQEKLLRNIMVGVHRSYSNNMFSFRNLKNHLSELVPMETLKLIQSNLSLQTLERVHVLIQHLTFEALYLQGQFNFDDRFFAPIITISKHMDAEFKEFIEARDESWERHTKAIMEFIQEETKSKKRLIKIDSEVLRCHQAHVIHYLVVSQCSSLIHECYRELQAKTMDREFRMVKESLSEACEKLDMILVTQNAIGV